MNTQQLEDLTNIFAKLVGPDTWAVPVWLSNLRVAAGLSPMNSFYVVNW